MSSRSGGPLTGWVFNIQRFSLHDGPGIRTTVFLKGCPLRCLWCHNPEGLESRSQIRLTANLCVHCGRCAAVCEHGGHTVTAEAHELRLEECVRCGECVEVCAAGALEMVGQRMTVEEALAVVRRDVPFYEASGGGMTLSGGEPLAQYDFTKALLTAAREEGIQTALETSALSIWERMEALQPLVNLFLVDLKHTDDARHRELTGVSNALILENIRRMSAREFPLTLRIPWIPGMNAEPTFLEGLIEFAACLSPRPPVEFLPYHRLHVSKRAALGMEASMPEEIPAAMPEEIAPWVERLAAEGIAARVR